MIPNTECIATASQEDAFDTMAWSTSRCEESRCNQLQTAADVYRRILERLHRQSACQDNYADAELLKRIWIASFTGDNIFYRA